MISTVNNIAHKLFPMDSKNCLWKKKISAIKDGYEQIYAMEKKFGYEKMSVMEEMLAKKKISPMNIKNTQDGYYSK